MSVRPVLLKDIRKTAVSAHQQQVGNGAYNRWTPLVSRDRAPSQGKRPLSGTDDDDIAKKAPKLDRKAIFEKVREQENVLKDLKTLAKEEDEKPYKTDGQTAIWKAIGMLIMFNEGLLSAVVDLDGVGSGSRGSGKEAAPTGSGVGFVGAGAKVACGGAVGGAIRPLPSVSVPPMQNEKKKMRQTLRDAEKNLLSSISILARFRS
jgi:hypothetical protein